LQLRDARRSRPDQQSRRTTRELQKLIVRHAFPGDDNQLLARIQHDTYWEHTGFLFCEAKERYIRAAHLVGVETELYQRVKSRTSFDHRVLQTAHDAIAGYYRFERGHGGQMPLPFGDMSWETSLRRSWHEWFCYEVGCLLDHRDALTRAILKAVAYESTKPSYAAEDELAGLLLDRYGNLTHKALQRQAQEREKSDAQAQE
jgi:hypothetical protein